MVRRLCLVQSTGPNSRAGTKVRARNGADVISYLNRMTVPVIGIESLRTQLSERRRPLHQPKGPRAGVCGAPRRTGTRCVAHKA